MGSYQKSEKMTTRVNEDSERHAALFGEAIKPELIPQKSQTITKFQFSSLFKSTKLKNLKLSAIVSVNSIYQKLIIRDSSIVKKYWDMIIELILAYNVITTLYFLAYQYPSGVVLGVDYAFWVIFMIDIGLTFLTEKVTENGLPIRKFNKLAWIYFKGSLVLDVLAIIPLRQSGHEDAEYYLRMVRLFKLPKIMDLTNGIGISYLFSYFGLGRRQKDGTIAYSYTSKIIASLIKLFISIIFTVYFLGCFFYWFQKTVAFHKYSKGDSSDEEVFFEAFDLKSLPSKDIALRSSYFMLTTISTIGFGDFLPKNIYEMSFIMCTMLFGVTLFAYIMGSFNNAITYYNEATSGIDYLGELNTWMDSLESLHGKIPEVLRNKILIHFEFYFSQDRLKSLAKCYWKATSPDDLSSIDQPYADLLPEETYYTILSTLFPDFCYNFNYYFKNPKFLLTIIPHLQPRQFDRKEMIFTHGEVIEGIMFILTGTVTIGRMDGEKFQIFIKLDGEKTVIGDYSVLTKVKNKYDYLAYTHVLAYSVNSEVFIEIANSFYKKEKNDILAIASTREKNLKRLMNDYMQSGIANSLVVTEEAERKKIFLPKPSLTVVYTEEEVDKELQSHEIKTNETSSTAAQILALSDSILEISSKIFSKLECKSPKFK